MLRLITIPISHYCEKARWALERVGMAYREERHVQGIHQFAARRAGGGVTVPVLVTPDGAIRELDFVAELLADGRPHLCGRYFGAADLTFAALSAPIVVPPEYGVLLPQPNVLPPRMAALVQRAREHPAGRYALALFTEHRRELVL